MGAPTEVRLINRKNSQQRYVNFPAAIAQAMQYERGGVVEWLVKNRQHLILRRLRVPAAPVAVTQTTLTKRA